MASEKLPELVLARLVAWRPGVHDVVMSGYIVDMLLVLIAASHAQTLAISVWDKGHTTESVTWAQLERDRAILDNGATHLRIRVRKRSAGGAVVRLDRCRRSVGDRCWAWTSLERLTFEYSTPDSWAHLEDNFVCGNQETDELISKVRVTWLGGARTVRRSPSSLVP